MQPAMAQLAAAVDAVVSAASELGGWAAIDALLAVDEQAGRLQGAAARLTARVDSDGLWATEGARSLSAWFAARRGASYRRARELVTTARALRDHLPRTAEAVLTGEVGPDHARILAQVAPTSEARRAVLAAPPEGCGEGFLLAQAHELGADMFGRLVRRWAAAADPGADERGYREASEREFVSLAATTGGMHLAGFLTTDHGATLAVALDAVTVVPAPDDTRTTQQRRAGALTDLARLALDHGLVGTGAAVRPQIACVVDFETLRRAVDGTPGGIRAGAGTIVGSGSERRAAERVRVAPAGTVGRLRLASVADIERFAVAEVLGAGPIPPSVLARLACDSEITRVVFGPDSQVINIGRAERTFTGPWRRAVIARDGTCRYPHCNAPPALGEIHHIEHWARDHGQTDVNAGCLLCWHHHGVVHALGIEITHSSTGGWVFTDRHGREIPRAA